MQLQMPVQAGNFPARMTVPRRLVAAPVSTNGLPQNGMSPQSNFSQGRTCFLSVTAQLSLLYTYD